jgi:dipeptidyl aminopeptidase/acylaminoacyl peptidase
LFKGFGVAYLPTGHLVYGLPNNNITSLMAVAFDLDRLEVKGGPVSILEGLRAVAISNSGTLVYVPQPGTAAASKVDAAGGAVSPGNTLVWVNRQGKEEPLAAAPKGYIRCKISPDGTRVALSFAESGNQDIWIWDVARGTMTRLTFDERGDGIPLWTPDGKRIVYTSLGGTQLSGIYWKKADGTGEV